MNFLPKELEDIIIDYKLHMEYVEIFEKSLYLIKNSQMILNIDTRIIEIEYDLLRVGKNVFGFMLEIPIFDIGDTFKYIGSAQNYLGGKKNTRKMFAYRNNEDISDISTDESEIETDSESDE